MGRTIIKITRKSPEEIKSEFISDEKLKQGYRLWAVYQVSKGVKPQDLTEVYDTSFKSIINWVHRYNKEGISGLKDKKKPGRPPRLTTDEIQKLRDIILNDKPENHGYNSGTWSGPIILNLIQKEFNKVYQKAQIYNILAKMNLTYKKGKGIYIESLRNNRQEQVETIKKTLDH